MNIIDSIKSYSAYYGEKIIDITEHTEKWSVIAFKISMLSLLIITCPFYIASVLSNEPFLRVSLYSFTRLKIWKISLPIPLPTVTPELRQAFADSPKMQFCAKLIIIPSYVYMLANSTLILSSLIKCTTSLCLRKNIRWDNWQRLFDFRSI